MSELGHRSARTRPAAAAAACALALLAAEPARGDTDRAFKTPVAHGSAASTTAISAAGLRSRLGRLLAAAGGRSGAFVLDAESGNLLFSRGSARKLSLASNTKLFTTTTALGSFEPQERLETSVWAGDPIDDGIVSEGLYLRGEGDPTLSSRGLVDLAKKVAAAGITRVKGPLLYRSEER